MSYRARRRLAAGFAGILVLLAGLACLGIAATTHTTHTTHTAPPVRVDIDRSTLTAPLPASFLGLALENGTVPKWVGDARSARRVDPVLVDLVRTLDPTGDPSIRIGGQSTDRSWWPVPGMPKPIGITQALTPAWTTDVQSLAQALHARLIVGINLEADSRAVSRHEADEFVKRISAPYLDAFEIGNEPGQYTGIPWYEELDGKVYPWYDRHVGKPVFSRVPSYDEADFLTEYQRTLSVLPRQVAIAGPDAAGDNWLAPFSRFVSPGGRVQVLDSHAYALSSCITNRDSPYFPSIPHLLAVSAWHGILDDALSSVALAHRDGLQFRIDEMGSVTCDGKAGVSDTMASALWVTNALMYAAREGVDGVNLHSFPHSSNGLFDISHGSHGWRAQIHPLFDGAVMFARADPAGARELRLSSDGPRTLQTWATIGADDQVRVLIVNTGTRRSVTIRAPAGFGSATGSVQRLLAPSVSSTRGLTLGGRSVNTTTTGRLPAPVAHSVQPGSAGYTVTAPAGSETLLTLSKPMMRSAACAQAVCAKDR
jgi:hypothetical protein